MKLRFHKRIKHSILVAILFDVMGTITIPAIINSLVVERNNVHKVPESNNLKLNSDTAYCLGTVH